MSNTIRDHDPPVGNLIDGAAVVDAAAGGTLLVFSDTIHNIIGLILIGFALFLFYYNRKERTDLPDRPAKADRSDLKRESAEEAS